jgi:hypothetical protein
MQNANKLNEKVTKEREKKKIPQKQLGPIVADYETTRGAAA